MVRANRALYEALRPIMLEKVKAHMVIAKDEETKALLLQLIRLQGTMLEVLTKVVTRMDEKAVESTVRTYQVEANNLEENLNFRVNAVSMADAVIAANNYISKHGSNNLRYATDITEIK